MGRLGSRSKIKKTTRVRQSMRKGGAIDIQKALSKTGIEFHWPGYQYLGPGTKFEND